MPFAFGKLLRARRYESRRRDDWPRTMAGCSITPRNCAPLSFHADLQRIHCLHLTMRPARRRRRGLARIHRMSRPPSAPVRLRARPRIRPAAKTPRRRPRRRQRSLETSRAPAIRARRAARRAEGSPRGRRGGRPPLMQISRRCIKRLAKSPAQAIAVGVRPSGCAWVGLLPRAWRVPSRRNLHLGRRPARRRVSGASHLKIRTRLRGAVDTSRPSRLFPRVSLLAHRLRGAGSAVPGCALGPQARAAFRRGA